MTSGIFQTIDPAAVTVNREARQRRDLRGITELANSITEIGLIHPIILTEEGVLVAGERRLEAVRSLGWTSIPYQLASDLNESELHKIELEENVKRQDLSWQDHTRAVAAYHELCRAADPTWSQAKTASALGYKDAHVSEHLAVHKQLTDPRVAQAPKFSVARGITSRANDRANASIISTVKTTSTGPGRIIHADFNLWTPEPNAAQYNFLHCDFPYGIGANNFNQGGAAKHGGYSDGVATYTQLLDRLHNFVELFVADSAHIMFWFSMRYYHETFVALSRDFLVDPFPLVWHKSDNVGILPDPTRGPRRTYETAFIGSRGDRKIVGAVANSFAGPTSSDIHMSEKPEPMLKHFFRMFIDTSSVVLDPTAGSGGSIRAAEAAGAAEATGLELDESFARLAQEALDKRRGK